MEKYGGEQNLKFGPMYGRYGPYRFPLLDACYHVPRYPISMVWYLVAVDMGESISHKGMAFFRFWW